MVSSSGANLWWVFHISLSRYMQNPHFPSPNRLSHLPAKSFGTWLPIPNPPHLLQVPPALRIVLDALQRRGPAWIHPQQTQQKMRGILQEMAILYGSHENSPQGVRATIL